MIIDKNCWRGVELRKYTKENYPNLFVITRKLSNQHAILIDKETGKIIKQASANYKIIDFLTSNDVDKIIKKKRSQGFFNDCNFEDNRRLQFQNSINELLGWAEEVEEWGGGEIKVKKTDNGYEVNINGRKYKQS